MDVRAINRFGDRRLGNVVVRLGLGIGLVGLGSGLISVSQTFVVQT